MGDGDASHGSNIQGGNSPKGVKARGVEVWVCEGARVQRHEA